MSFERARTFIFCSDYTLFFVEARVRASTVRMISIID